MARMIALQSVVSALEMFDGYVDTQTEVAEAISEDFDVSDCTAVVCLNNYGTTARLQVYDNDLSEYYYDQTVSLIRDSIKDAWDYCFAPCRTGKDHIYYFESRSNATATITITYTGGTAKCGLCLPGKLHAIGNTRYGATVGIDDYSINDTNDFGITYLLQGTWAKRADCDMFIYNVDMNTIFRKIAGVRGTAAVWDFNRYTGSELTSDGGYQCLIIYGFFEDFSIQIPGPVISDTKLEVQGLT